MHRNILGGINRKSSSFIKRTLWSRFCIWGFCAQPRPRSVQVDVQVRVSQVPRLPWISLPKVGRGTWLSPSALFKGLWLCCAQWLWWAGTRHWAQIVWIFWIFLSRTFILYNRQTEQDMICRNRPQNESLSLKSNFQRRQIRLQEGSQLSPWTHQCCLLKYLGISISTFWIWITYVVVGRVGFV